MQPGGTGQAAGSYGYNWWFYDGTGNYTWWKKPYGVKQPSDLPLMADGSADDPFNLGHLGSGGAILRYQNPHSWAYKYGWQGGKFRTGRDNYGGPAALHGPFCNFLMADMHVEPRNVCVAGKWPWLGSTATEQQSGRAFHPTRTLDKSGKGVGP